VQVSFTFNAEGATLKGTVAGQGDFMGAFEFAVKKAG
jgi:hypothetical protein